MLTSVVYLKFIGLIRKKYYKKTLFLEIIHDIRCVKFAVMKWDFIKIKPLKNKVAQVFQSFKVYILIL